MYIYTLSILECFKKQDIFCLFGLADSFIPVTVMFASYKNRSSDLRFGFFMIRTLNVNEVKSITKYFSFPVRKFVRIPLI